jgi:phytoene dehydrogenase-like protein
MTPSLVIIGAGMAGLSAGIFARMNGFQTEIIEMHGIPGGMCTAWKRKGYTFDLCIQCLSGSKPGTALNRLYGAIGLLDKKTFVSSEYWKHVRDSEGNELTLYNTPDRLEEELLRFSPEDAPFIRTFCRDIGKLQSLETPVERSILDTIRLLPLMKVMNRYRQPPEASLAKIKNPLLRRLLIAGLDWDGQSASFPMMGLAWQGSGNGGYPLGGSAPLAQSLEKRFLDLGGSIRYGARVKTIVVEDGRACGVTLSDDSTLPADGVISCADGRTTIFEMLDGKYCSDRIGDMYRDLTPFPPLLFFSLGIGADLSDLPDVLTYVPEHPVEIGGAEHAYFNFYNFAKDPGLYPPGKGVITVWVPVSWEHWEQFPYQGEAYRREKERAGERIVELFGSLYPHLAGSVEVCDVASPMTFSRYTGVWKGAYEGWLVTPDAFFVSLPNTLPGLSRFAMAGQWVVTGGGISGAVISARRAVQQICGEFDRPFRDGT